MRGVLTVLSLTAECSPRQQIIESSARTLVDREPWRSFAWNHMINVRT